MINDATDFFIKSDNFKKTAQINSIPILLSKLEYTPLVTIAIPTFKRKISHLKESLDSALNQCCDVNYDVVIVDNNPERDDDTELFLKQYNSPKLSYYKNEENLGMVGNWNRLYILAKGEWVVMLHDDDVLKPNYLSEVMSIITKKDLSMLAVRCDLIENNQLVTRRVRKNSLIRLKPIDFAFGNRLGPPVGIILNKKIFLESGGFNDEFYPTSDYCFYVYFCLNYKLYLYNKVLATYRVDDNTSTQVEILNKFVENDYFLTKSILKNIYMFKCIYNPVLKHIENKQIKHLNSFWNVDLNYRFSSSGFSNKIVYKITYRFSRALRKINFDSFFYKKFK